MSMWFGSYKLTDLVMFGSTDQRPLNTFTNHFPQPFLSVRLVHAEGIHFTLFHFTVSKFSSISQLDVGSRVHCRDPFTFTLRRAEVPKIAPTNCDLRDTTVKSAPMSSHILYLLLFLTSLRLSLSGALTQKRPSTSCCVLTTSANQS